MVTPAKVAGASIEELLDNLKLPEYRTRYRTRRELRGRSAAEVLSQLHNWMEKLDKNDSNYEHHLLEALWVSWGLNKIDTVILHHLLQSKDYHVRAAAVRAVRYNRHQQKNGTDLLLKAAADPHGRVRVEVITAASRMDKPTGVRLLAEARKKPLDKWIKEAHQTAVAHLNGKKLAETKEVIVASPLKGKELALFTKGKAIYARDGFCITCHQKDGKGLPNAGFPPLTGTKWVIGSEDRLIKIVLNGLYGPIEVAEQKYRGDVPMTPFGAMLKDEEVAAVLTYVRNAFGNRAPTVLPDKVRKVRASAKAKKGFYTPEELLKVHPMEKDRLD
jgi:mono/diheme cytochrome c family protein